MNKNKSKEIMASTGALAIIVELLVSAWKFVPGLKNWVARLFVGKKKFRIFVLTSPCADMIIQLNDVTEFKQQMMDLNNGSNCIVTRCGVTILEAELDGLEVKIASVSDLSGEIPVLEPQQ